MLRIQRSEDHTFEATVKVDCTITRTALYEWRLTYRNSSERLTLTNLGLEPSNNFFLPMPPRTLEYGNYTLTLQASVLQSNDCKETKVSQTACKTSSSARVQCRSGNLSKNNNITHGKNIVLLQVTMGTTIVRSEASLDFDIVKTPLQAVILGGLERLFGPQEEIVLDGGGSVDPDFPENTTDFQ